MEDVIGQLKEYRDELREIINDPESGMLLDANDLFDINGNPIRGEGWVFELTSGSYQQHFITLWELFDRRSDFSLCVSMFALAAREIRRKVPFSSIVTCTETAKYVMDHIHSAVETDKEKISVHYLGDYPFLSPDNRGLINFKNERVLIITDVVATGTLVRNLAKVVEEVGGTPVAALCVAITGEDLIDILMKTGKPPIIEFGEKKSKIRVHSLTDLLLPRMSGAQVDPNKVRKIDPVAVLPEEQVCLNGLKRIFDESQMFAHFEAAGAIDFNFYQTDITRFAVAIRINRLLKECGNEIWEAISDVMPPDPVFVTTFNREDVRFKEFVEEKLGGNPEFVFAPRRDSLSYFILPSKVRKIKKRRVVLLLSSVHTSEKLRSLASMLASHSVIEITVICLLNRMGAHTMNFISRIKNLLSGVGEAQPGVESAASFDFIAIYDMRDLRSEDITKMQQTVATLFSHYSASTRVPSFRRLMNQDQKYFRSNSLTARGFEKAKPTLLGRMFSLPDDPIAVNSMEGKLFLLCSRLVATRDHGPFIEEMRSFDDKETLYRIFGILMCDLGYLKMKGRFKTLREKLIERIRGLRRYRFGLEETPSMINHVVETEAFLTFGVALFSFLDKDYDYHPFMFEMLSCGKTPEQWLDCPENLLCYFGDERVVWTISLLMHFSIYRFKDFGVARDFKEQMRAAINRFMKTFDEGIGKDSPLTKRQADRKQRVKQNLYFLLTELGALDHKRRYRIVRYLQSKTINVRRGHNPINSSLSNAVDALGAVVAFPDEDQAEPFPGDNPNKRVSIEKRAVKKALEEAVYNTGILEQIAASTIRMFDFTPAARSKVERYTNGSDSPGFAFDINQLGDLLQNIRIVNSVSGEEVEKLRKLMGTIFIDLWDDGSMLRQTLLDYIVPLNEVLIEAMTWANKRLSSGHLGEIWLSAVSGLEDSAETHYVLIDKYLLREVLRNVLHNVRHSLKNYSPAPGTAHSELVSVSIRNIQRSDSDDEDDNPGEVEYVQLKVASAGLPFEQIPPDSTFGKHQIEVERWGGKLEFDTHPANEGAVVTLTMLRRQLPQEDHAEEERRI